ncbi:MAG: TIGR04086 family membrane protein [Clostridiales bacterium]|nr:TIGR04086 family membrane protein [Clostridiales bacterium]
MNTKKSKIIKGMLLSYGITIVVFSIFGALFYFTTIDDTHVSIIVKVTILISVLLGALISGKRVGIRGWLVGGTTGFMYTLTLLITSMLFMKNFSITSHSIKVIAINTLVGMFGGIVGVNTNSSKGTKN